MKGAEMDGLDSQKGTGSRLADVAAASVRELDPAWLRDNCQCADCRDPVSGQRLISIADQPAGVSLADVTDTADGWHVRFEPDGHQAIVTRAWLGSQLTPEADRRTEDAKQMWSAADFPAGPPAVSRTDYLTSDATRLGCLRQLLSAGFMLLRGVPPEPGAVLDVAATMGYVRETNYGRLFDVRVEATPANLAFTGLPIGPHTDNPYRDPVPSLQLLHCLVSAADGGQSGLLDGFRAAGMLRAEDPAAFDCLTRTPVTFGYRDQEAELRATRPMIGVDMAGRIREVRYNSRSMQPIRPAPAAGHTPGQAAGDMREFYRAYRAFATTLLRPELTLRFSLEPGDCVVFDNTRVLHSRTGFTATGHRHLQGCYADIDGAESTVAVLARGDTAAPDAADPEDPAPDAPAPEDAAPDARPAAANIDG
jgi:gamma-butyrobetaine dioxygenase